MHNIHDLLLSCLKSSATSLLKFLVRKFGAVLLTALFTLRVGDTVSWLGDSFLVLEKRREGFVYAHKIMNLKGINPWLIPLIVSNPSLAKDAAVFWYKGFKLKKTGHPVLGIALKNGVNSAA